MEQIGFLAAGGSYSAVRVHPDKSRQRNEGQKTKHPTISSLEKKLVKVFEGFGNTWLPKATCAAMELAPCLLLFKKFPKKNPPLTFPLSCATMLKNARGLFYAKI